MLNSNVIVRDLTTKQTTIKGTVLVDTNWKAVHVIVASTGQLIFDVIDGLNVEVSSILVQGGSVWIGGDTDECAWNNGASRPISMSLTLLDAVFEGPVDTKTIEVQNGGVFNVRGALRSHAWTTLRQSVQAGGNTLHLSESVDWKVGENVLITPTDYDPTELETRRIVSVSSDGMDLTLSSPLFYDHFGQLPDQNFGVDERAEVALLSRNISIMGDEYSESDRKGGVIRVEGSGTVNLIGVQMVRMGDTTSVTPAIEFEGSSPSSVIQSTLSSYEGAVLLRYTSEKVISDNVFYGAVDYSVWLDYSSNNVLTGNLVTNIVGAGTAETDAIGISVKDIRNIVSENRVSGCIGLGYSIASDGFIYEPDGHQSGFSRNRARSIGLHCFHFERYRPKQTVIFDQLMASKCSAYGILSDDGLHRFINATISSSWAGVRFEKEGQELIDSTILAVTNNAPNSAPKSNQVTPFVMSQPRRGVHLIEGPHHFSGITFVGFNQGKSACFAPYGNRIVSRSTTLENISCNNGQSMFYVNDIDAEATDSERFFASQWLQNTTDGRTVTVINKSTFMKLSPQICPHTISPYSLGCDQDLYTEITITDVYKLTTQYKPEIKPSEPKAAIVRVVATTGKITAAEHIVGISETLDDKIDQYQLRVPHGGSIADVYGIVFEVHSTPSTLKLNVGPVLDTRIIIALCYHPLRTKFKSLKINGQALAQFDTHTDFEKSLKHASFFNTKVGTLLVKIVPTSVPSVIDVTADVLEREPFFCFDNKTIEVIVPEPVPSSAQRPRAPLFLLTLFSSLLIYSLSSLWR